MNEETKPKEKSPYVLIVAIIIAAWLIGMAILTAGWLISREIARQSVGDDYGNDLGPIGIEVPNDKPVLGNSDAKVTVIEFADYQCPFCGEWQKTIFQNLKTEYIETGKVKFVYWDFAFLGAESYRAAEASACAKDQDKYWEYNDKLFANQKGENELAFSDNNLIKFASELELDQDDFSKCLLDNTYQNQVEESLQLGTGYGVNSTPTVFINGYRLEGLMPWNSYKQLIESELNKTE